MNGENSFDGRNSEPARSEKGSSIPALIISPVRDEVEHVEIVARAMAAQTRPPAVWIVVDDGSVDGTLERFRALESKIPFLQVMALPRRADEQAKDRLATGSCIRAFNWALEQSPCGEFDFIGKLDGDIELPPTYFERLVERFELDPKLGVGSGSLAEPRRSGWKRIGVPHHNVPGPIKLYRTECLEAIGRLPASLGWDTMDETYARMRGFTTRSFRDIVVRHHRPGASRDGVLRGRARYGRCAYINHYTPRWIALRSLKVATQKPFVLSGLAFLYGYWRAASAGVHQVPDDEYRAFVRRELRQRMQLRHRVRLHGPYEQSASVLSTSGDLAA